VKITQLYKCLSLAKGIKTTKTGIDIIAPATYQSLQKVRILLAEDNIVNQKVALTILQKRGYDVNIAVNGQEVLKALEKTSYDVILMDVHMPEMDGIETTLVIREKEKLTGKHIPIIAMTASAMKSDIDRCLQAGMDDYLTKPVQPSELFQTIERHVFGKISPEKKPVTDEPSDSNELFNRNAMLSRLDGDEDLLNELVELFLENAPKVMEELKQALKEKDLSLIKVKAHTMKGSSGNVSADAINSLASEIENLAKNGKLDKIDILVKEMEEKLNNSIFSITSAK
jgi:CheY-like chemotaxis protein